MAPRKDIQFYWLDRIEEQNTRNLELSKKETKRLLRELYKEQGEKLFHKIETVFLKLLSDAADGKIYINDLYRTHTYHELLNYFNECAKAIGGEQVKITEDALIDMYELSKAVVEKEVPKSLVKSSFVVPTAINAKQAIHQTWCLDGEEFSDRIWKNKKKLVEDLSHTMADFIARGESPYSIAQGIVKRLAVDEYCAFRIARTETAHAQVKGMTDKYREMGFTHGKYLAREEAKITPQGVKEACDICQELNGKIFTLKELESMIPKHPNCECSFTLEVD